MRRLRLGGLAALALLLAAFGGRGPRDDQGFDHWKHRKLFPSCQTCHAGAEDASQPLWPAPESCRSCHDGKTQLANGTVLQPVDWQKPTVSLVSNLRFTHERHAREFRQRLGADSSATCLSCHGDKGAQWMQVAPRPVNAQCLACHGITVAHYAAPDTACATCHLPLAEARELPRERIAKFPEPDSHKQAGFYPGKGHGDLARGFTAGRRQFAVAPSCATCHAREFCIQCHVNAPEVPLIQALAPDPRSLAIEAKLEAPEDHKDPRFQGRHGALSRKTDATCANCHTQQSCLACHRASPGVAVAMYPAGPDRGAGARIERHRPASHTEGFADHHAALASASASSCSACHARAECLECHRPSAGSTDSYHPAGFLSRHPSAAYARQSDCSDCHNTGSFCTSCHAQAGFRSVGGLTTGSYHDTKSGFLAGHGQAARQNMESCITCHSEKDCLACHSAQTRRFNPHGPGFDADRLRRKNPQTCAACHGRNIPGG